jgi:CRP-like cAMP-binding protein
MTENALPTSPEELVAKLRKIQVFSDLPQDDLLWFVSKGEEHRAAVGDILIREGEPADRMMVILEGEMRARSERGNPDGPVFTVRGGEVTGLLPFSRLKILSITGRTILPMY